MKETIQKLAADLLNTWRALGVNQRITIGFSGAAVLLGLLSLGYWSSQPNLTMLYGNLSPKEANKVVTFLENNSITFELRNSGNSIYIPNDQVHKVRIDLAAQGIPQKGESVGLEIFDRPAFGLSNMQQRVNYMRGIQGELTRTIRQMDGIETAEVMVVIPENQLLIDSTIRSSASVFIKTGYAYDVSANQVRAIQLLVANAVEGLMPANVTVATADGRLLSREEDPSSLSAITDRQLETRRQLESYLSQKAQEMLTTVLGPGKSIVRVSATLNFNTETTSKTTFDADTVPRSTTQTTEIISSSTGANTSTNAVAAATALEESNTETSTTDTEYAVSSTTNDIVKMAGGTTELTAAVFIAKEIEFNNNGEMVTTTNGSPAYIDRSPAEMESLKRIVAKTLGITNLVDNLSIEQFAFNQPAKGRLDLPEEEAFQKRAFEVIQDWQPTVQPFVFAILGLAIIRAFWKKLGGKSGSRVEVGMSLQDYAQSLGSNGHPLPTATSDSSGMVNLGGESELVNDDSGRVLSTDILNRLFRENPDNMTRAIRTWLQKDEENANN